ncbi:MAG: hypothetical protein WCC82_03050 [Nitrososphaeraceae archaeon]
MIHEVYLDHIRTCEPARLASVVSGEVAVPVVRWLKPTLSLSCLFAKRIPRLIG